MLFTFKRDEEGRERIYVGDVCVAQFYDSKAHKEWEFVQCDTPTLESMRMEGIIDDAIERADEAGFWESRDSGGVMPWGENVLVVPHEVTVDVSVAELSTTLVVVSEGE